MSKKIECMLKNRMFPNTFFIFLHKILFLEKSSFWKFQHFLDKIPTNNLISVEAAKVLWYSILLTPFIHTYLQTLTRPRTSMVLGFRTFNINEPAVLIEELERNPVSLSGSFIIVLKRK
jgi:hypothetical protein